MLARSRNRLTKQTRRGAGSQLADFGAALVIFTGFVIVPLVDLTIVPIRWMLAQTLVNDYARKLSLCETFSESRDLMNADPSLQTRLMKLGGVAVESISLRLRINRVFASEHREEFFVAEHPRDIPQEWLPNGPKAPCSYMLEVDVKSLMSPAILLPFTAVSIPGLTTPIPILLTASHEFANCAPDPSTGRFYLNQ